VEHLGRQAQQASGLVLGQIVLERVTAASRAGVRVSCGEHDDANNREARQVTLGHARKLMSTCMAVATTRGHKTRSSRMPSLGKGANGGR
jgi:hypothetical protein